MSNVANLYDNGPISPIARIQENLSIWSENKWKHFGIKFIEGIPRSSATTVEMVTASGATTIPPYGTIAKRVLPVLQMNAGEMLHLRWEPLDDVEGVLWELGGQARFSPRGAHARVSLVTSTRDPYLATTTFYILGGVNLDMNLEARNPLPVAQATARFVFFGYRYLLEPLSGAKGRAIELGQIPSTWLPAQGR